MSLPGVGEGGYLEVMRQKSAITGNLLREGTIHEDTVMCLWDDDYIFNPWIFKWLVRIYDDPRVVYSAPIWPGASGVIVEDRICGFPVYWRESCMGGSVCVRAEAFLHDFDAYCEGEDLDAMFDQGFWTFLRKMKKEELPILVTGGFSLIQHLNYGTHYGKVQEPVMEGINFLMGNPWEMTISDG
jgi:hypothetical protein